MSDKILLGWFMHPDELDFYVIENPTKVQRQVLENACGQMINIDEYTEDAKKIMLALTEDKYVEETKNYIEKELIPWVGIWNKLEKIPWTKEINLEGISKLCIGGFAF